MLLIMVSLLIALVIVVFSVQNSIVVPIVFFGWSSEIPLVIVIFVSVLAGATIIFCLALWKELKRKFGKVSSKASTYKEKFDSKKVLLTAKKDNETTINSSSTPTSDILNNSTIEDVISEENPEVCTENAEDASPSREDEGPIPIERL